jgi:hypothetical protein
MTGSISGIADARIVEPNSPERHFDRVARVGQFHPWRGQMAHSRTSVLGTNLELSNAHD